MKTLIAAAEPPEREGMWILTNGGTIQTTTTTTGMQVTTVTIAPVVPLIKPPEEA